MMEVKPFLKWCGGKRQLLPELEQHVISNNVEKPFQFGRYYEPFVGGGALFFHLRALGWKGPATLGDANERLVRTYQGVQTDVQRVIAALRHRKYDRVEYEAERGYAVDMAAPWRTAVWLIYLNRCGYNGLYRVNKQGGYNAPFGKYTNPLICDAEGLHNASRALAGAKLVPGDFEKVVKDAKAGDLVYFDPPYSPVSETADFTAYTADGFTHEDQIRLRDCAERLKKKGVRVILSNADCLAVRSLYKTVRDGGVWNIDLVQARRAINSDASKRGAVGELIIT